MNNLSKLIDKKIQEWKEKGEFASQSRIAYELEMNPSTLSLIKNGKTDTVNFEVWERMAKYFNVEGSEIFNVVLDEACE